MIVGTIFSVFAIAAWEYALRRYGIFRFPVIGALQINDMIMLAALYGPIIGTGAYLYRSGRWKPEETRENYQQFLRAPGNRRIFVALVLALAASSQVDPWLFGRWNDAVGFFDRSSALRESQGAVLEGARMWLHPVSLLLVNGIVVPVGEELFWRGFAQHRLRASLSAWPAVVVIALAFSLKHAVVDASLSRLSYVFLFGCIAGFLKERAGLGPAILFHTAMNLMATTLFIGLTILPGG